MKIIKKREEYHQWEDYRWQIENSWINTQDIIEMGSLNEQELLSIKKKNIIKIPPYFYSLIDFADQNCPIRKQVIPRLGSNCFKQDVLNEQLFSVTPYLVHKYRNRALFIISIQCAFNCTFCTRTRIKSIKAPSMELLKDSFRYLSEHKEINEVILSGGDPLLLDDSDLLSILESLKRINHIKVVRIGTRVPIALPMRITKELLEILEVFPVTYINIHVNHPKEITERVKKCLFDLSKAGCILGSQTVLLREINDNVEILSQLFTKLIQCRVRPYYLFQCDHEAGCENFVVDINKGIKLINEVQKKIGGLGVPKYVVDSAYTKNVLGPVDIGGVYEA